MDPVKAELARICDLRQDLDAGDFVEIPGQIDVSHTQYGDPLQEFIPDTETQQAARDALRSIYYNSSHKEARESAGRALDYGCFKIFAHEHPRFTKAAFAVIGTAAAAYAIWELASYFADK